MRSSTAATLLACLIAGGLGCVSQRSSDRAATEDVAGHQVDSLSADAKVANHQLFLEDLAAERHSSDGGGRAWLEGGSAPGEPVRVRAGGRERFTIVYEAGPLGVAEGGVVFLETSLFWHWEGPQPYFDAEPGFTTIESEAPGITLTPLLLDRNLLGVQISGRSLEEGERIRLTLGAGPRLVGVDRYAESESPIWIAVDGDGDGTRALIAQSPTIEVTAGEPARLLLTLPTTARPGEHLRLTIAVLDSSANAGAPFEGEVILQSSTRGMEFPVRVLLRQSDRGRKTIEVLAGEEGIYRLTATAAGGLQAESNPLVVRQEIDRVYWGDLHGHSQISDGSATPEQYFEYARDVAGLDLVALTDHDHWGLRFLDANPDLWERIRDAGESFNEPGRFVTLLGYEWTSWLHGHRHVLYFSGEGQVFSSINQRYETPAQLWQALRGQAALTVAHHSAGGPISTNWDYAPDPLLEPVTEIVSVHGSSEAADAPGLIYDPVEGNFVRDVLDRGYRFGFIGSGDGHDGHPGLAYLEAPEGKGGLAAIVAPELTRMSLYETLQARHVYATNGPRIWLSVTLEGRPMGSLISTSTLTDATDLQLEYAIATTSPIARIELIRKTGVEELPGCEDCRERAGELRVSRLEAGEYIYLRVIQEDQGAAWSSPFYFE